MVKGVTKRVVVIKSPDKRIFEEAIFIVREEMFKGAGVSAEDVINEACRVAAAYVRKNVGAKKLPTFAVIAISAAVICAVTGIAAYLLL